MRKTYFTILVLSATLYWSCNPRVSDGNYTDTDPLGTREIVLIFNQHQLANPTGKSVFRTPNQISYYNDQLIRVSYVLNNKQYSDTVVIGTQKKLLNFKLFHNYVDYHYFFYSGDTVVFDFDGDSPVVSRVNREPKPYDLNISRQLKERFGEALKGSGVLTIGPQDSTSIARFFADYYQKNLQKKTFLDSLYSKDLLSKDIFEHYTTLLNSELYVQAIGPNPKQYPQNLVQMGDIHDFVNRSDFVGQTFYHDFLTNPFLWRGLFEIKVVRHAQGMSLDYKDGYDKLKSMITNPHVRDWLLFYCLEKIGENGSRDEFNSYLSAFKTDVIDTLYADYLDRNYGDDLLNVEGETMLVNILKNQKIEFVDYLSRARGEVVYVDLWASWCIPCRAVMPASKELKRHYRDRPIRFLYLSLDDKFSNWEQAAQEEGLFGHLDNYLLVNPKEAVLLKNVQVRTIPRYLIYDKQGELVHHNAPGPDSPELIALLDRYLE